MKNHFLFFIAIISFASCELNTNKNERVPNIDASSDAVPTNLPDTDVALNFINGYVDNCNKMSDALSAVDWVHTNMTASVSFKNELNRIMEEAYEIDPEMGLGFDPIFNAQDYPEEGFVLESVNAETGYLTVSGKDWKEFRLPMRLVNQGNEWLVDGCGIVNIPAEKQMRG